LPLTADDGSGEQASNQENWSYFIVGSWHFLSFEFSEVSVSGVGEVFSLSWRPILRDFSCASQSGGNPNGV
jgi:hypothetical protein